jgi:anti-sigma B factor antagonist
MSVIISERSVQDITILDCAGRITQRVAGSPEPGGSEILRDKLRQVIIEGKKNLILNLGRVRYIDSAGIGELVSGFSAAVNCGGALKLLNANKRVGDLLRITRLITAFEVFDDEVTALRSFGLSALFEHCKCPLCGLRSTPPRLDGDCCWPPQDCFHCGAAFTVELSKTTPPGTVLVKTVTLEGLWREYYTLVSGPPFTIEIPPRLDLFSSHALKKIWNAIPKPRRVVFDLQRITEIDSGGREAFLMLLTEHEQDAKIAVSLEGLVAKLSKDFPAQRPFYQEYASARLSLGDVSDTPPLFVSTGRL